VLRGNTTAHLKLKMHTGSWSPRPPGLQAPDVPIPRHPTSGAAY
jgi:hypothetical protein